jgi:WD domain, G-beta repeat
MLARMECIALPSLIILSAVIGAGLPVGDNKHYTHDVGDYLPQGAIARLDIVGFGANASEKPDAGRQARIMSLAFGPKNTSLIATAGEERHIRLWDFRTGKEIRQLSGKDRWIRAVAISPDGKQIASGGPDGTVALWDTLTSKEKTQSQACSYCIVDLAFSPDGRWVAPRDLGGNLQLLHAANLKPHPLDAKLATSAVMAFNSESNGFAAAEADRDEVSLWDLSTGKQLLVVANLECLPKQLAVSSDGKRLFVGSFRKAVLQFNADTGEPLNPPLGNPAGVRFMALSPDGRLLATVPLDTWEVQVWEVISGLARCSFGGTNGITALAFSPDGHALATCNNENAALIWDVLSTRRKDVAAASKNELEACWQALATDRPGNAIGSLVVEGSEAVALLRARFADAVRRDPSITKLIQNLDDPTYAVRQKAQKALESFGETVRFPLEQLLRDKPTLELRRRAELVLSRLPSWNPPIRSPHLLRLLRSLEVLEHIGTPEARAVLNEVADLAPATKLADEAKAAIKRLFQSPSNPKAFDLGARTNWTIKDQFPAQK